jgi:hypothetical protein
MIKKTIHLLSVSVVLFLTSCTKQEQSLTEVQKEQNAIAQIKSIVGNNVTVTILNNKTNQTFINNGNVTTNSITDSVKILSLDEFKKIVASLKDSIKYLKVPSIDTNSLYKAFDDSNDGPGGPGKPGKPGRAGDHLQSLYTPYMLSGSSPNNLLSTLNIYYTTDASGRVIGNPNIYFTGLSLFSWTQQSNNPTIVFNPNTFTSSFTVNGTTLYGIKIGNTDFGVLMGSSYKVVIHMDSQWGSDGWVEISSGTDGIK